MGVGLLLAVGAETVDGFGEDQVEELAQLPEVVRDRTRRHPRLIGDVPHPRGAEASPDADGLCGCDDKAVVHASIMAAATDDSRLP
ncbi:hypothetical protein V9L24_30105 [Streptomyces sp. CCNWLW230]